MFADLKGQGAKAGGSDGSDIPTPERLQRLSYVESVDRFEKKVGLEDLLFLFPLDSALLFLLGSDVSTQLCSPLCGALDDPQKQVKPSFHVADICKMWSLSYRGIASMAFRGQRGLGHTIFFPRSHIRPSYDFSFHTTQY